MLLARLSPSLWKTSSSGRAGESGGTGRGRNGLTPHSPGAVRLEVAATELPRQKHPSAPVKRRSPSAGCPPSPLSPHLVVAALPPASRSPTDATGRRPPALLSLLGRYARRRPPPPRPPQRPGGAGPLRRRGRGGTPAARPGVQRAPPPGTAGLGEAGRDYVSQGAAGPGARPRPPVSGSAAG